VEKLAVQIIDTLKSKELCKALKQLINNVLLPQAKDVYESSLLNTTSSQARLELCKMKNDTTWLDIENQQIDFTQTTTTTLQLRPSLVEDQSLFIVTLGSQEGAFENVRMTYAGDHGQQIKQLIQAHSIRRVSMCCVATKNRKHLFVTHEKGKSSHFTILQLNALLKQDSNKRNKLTLTKLNTIPVPFTLISIVANNFNEDYIALTGLKDCYVMYLNENGQTRQELFQTNASTSAKEANLSQSESFTTGLIVLHPSLESSNYIIKSMWLPGSKTELALVTNDFIKIYDLSVDKISPIYYFLLPMGKIKDLTFVYDIVKEERVANMVADTHFPQRDQLKTFKCKKYLVIMSSNGYMYYEEMNEATSARNGVYYVTNTIDVNVSSLNTKDQSEQKSTSNNFFFGAINKAKTSLAHSNPTRWL
jgi:E3 ubiquitin-protein ligase UBR4